LAYPLIGSQRVEYFGGPRGRGREVSVWGTDLRIPVQVVEELGDPALREPLGVRVDLLITTRQQQPAAAIRRYRLSAGPEHAAAHDPHLIGVAAHRGGRRPDYLDALADPGQVGTARGQPAVSDPADALQGRPGDPAQQDGRPARLNRLGCHPAPRHRVEAA
jgi:hypothetical protein